MGTNPAKQRNVNGQIWNKTAARDAPVETNDTAAKTNHRLPQGILSPENQPNHM